MRISSDHSIRVVFFVGAVFFGLGIYLPFFPVLLQERGFGAVELSILFSAPLFVKITVTPFLIGSVDRWGGRRNGTLLYASAAFSAFFTFGQYEAFALALLFIALYGMFWSALIPLGDTFTLFIVRNSDVSYGQIRLWGSVAFILGNVLSGVLLDVMGEKQIFPILVSCSILVIIAAYLLPTVSNDEKQVTNQNKRSIFQLIQNWPVGLKRICFAAACVQASHALLYTFGTVHWISLSFSATMIGILWATGVVAEIILFIVAPKFSKNLSAKTLVLIGSLAAIVRWSLTGHVEEYELVFLLQILHGLSFGATHLGLQMFIEQKMSDSDTPKAQGLVAFFSGLMMASATLGAGFAFDLFQGAAFWIMALVAAFGGGFLILQSGSTPKTGLGR